MTIFFWAGGSLGAICRLFIARISRGRTFARICLRRDVHSSGLYLRVVLDFGNSAIDLVSHGAVDLGQVALEDPAMGMFRLFEHYPYASVWSLAAVVIGLIFFRPPRTQGAGSGQLKLERPVIRD